MGEPHAWELAEEKLDALMEVEVEVVEEPHASKVVGVEGVPLAL